MTRLEQLITVEHRLLQLINNSDELNLTLTYIILHMKVRRHIIQRYAK